MPILHRQKRERDCYKPKASEIAFQKNIGSADSNNQHNHFQITNFFSKFDLWKIYF